MFTILLLLISLLWSAGIIILKKKSGAEEILDTILGGMMLFCAGIGGLFAFTGHAFMADQVAGKIGWPAGSPFQFEVAVANLAFGILGLMSVKFRDDFRLATAVGYAVFLLGAAAGHIREIILKGNNAEYNSGAFLFVGDIFVPLALLALAVVNRRLQHGKGGQ